MDNEWQRAGDITATVISLLLPVADAAEALGITGKIASMFEVAEAADEGGHFLQAGEKGTSAYVEIWAKGEDEVPIGMTRAEAETLKEELVERGELVAGPRNHSREQRILTCSVLYL